MDAVIKAMVDTNIDAGISRSVIPVLAKLDSLSAKADAYAGIKSKKQIRNRWIIGTLLGTKDQHRVIDLAAEMQV